MGYIERVDLNHGDVARCPHCRESHGFQSGDFEIDSTPDLKVTTDDEGYCRDWPDNQYIMVVCLHCQMFIALNFDRHESQAVPCRSLTDLRYLENVGL
ncbi:MAG: hypothetical protein COB78_05810 [Hyphomicrobiales bacterium]|nr:MAG: hypothetical protein COB78_05810 [Hyphomicrobiales bacterium]